MGALFEIRTFLVARNHMILGYKMMFSSISADSIILSNVLLVGRMVGREPSNKCSHIDKDS